MNLDIVKAVGPRAITPDVPEEARIILAGDAAFKEGLRLAARQRYIAMHKRQEAMARDTNRVEHKAVNGLGEHFLRVDRELYHQMQGLYGQDCWADEDFVNAFHRDNPACRVKTTRGTRGQEYAGRGR